MRGARCFLLAAAACLFPGHGGHADEPAVVMKPGSIEWTLPVREGGSLKVALVSDGSVLQVSETFPLDVRASLQPDSCVSLFMLAVDADNDAGTGLGRDERRPGFEYQLMTFGCGPRYRLYKPPSPPPAGSFAMFETKRYTSREGRTERIHEFPWQSPTSLFDGRTVVVAVPYSEMGLKPGQVVRIGTDATEDVVLTLK